MISDLLSKFPGEDEVSFAKRKAYYIRIVQPRIEYGNKTIESKLPSAVPLTKSEKEDIDAFWDKFICPDVRERLIDYRFYSVFKSALLDHKCLSRYIPDSFFYAFVDEYYTNPQHSVPCQEKNLYDLFLHDINRPRTVFRKIRNTLLDENYQEISFDTALEKIRSVENAIINTGFFSYASEGIFWDHPEDEEEQLRHLLQKSNSVICHEVVKQHPVLIELNSSSINTIRIMTLAFNDKVYVLSRVVRFGKSGNRTDSVSAGGLACGVAPDGRLSDIAYDASARKHMTHPSGKPFASFSLPNYHECDEMVISLAKRFMSLSRLISWDVDIDEKGNPRLLAFYLSFGGINLHQICNGPVFGEMTEEVLDEVFKNSYTLTSILKSMQ